MGIHAMYDRTPPPPVRHKEICRVFFTIDGVEDYYSSYRWEDVERAVEQLKKDEATNVRTERRPLEGNKT